MTDPIITRRALLGPRVHCIETRLTLVVLERGGGGPSPSPVVIHLSDHGAQCTSGNEVARLEGFRAKIRMAAEARAAPAADASSEPSSGDVRFASSSKSSARPCGSREQTNG